MQTGRPATTGRGWHVRIFRSKVILGARALVSRSIVQGRLRLLILTIVGETVRDDTGTVGVYLAPRRWIC